MNISFKTFTVQWIIALALSIGTGNPTHRLHLNVDWEQEQRWVDRPPWQVGDFFAQLLFA